MSEVTITRISLDDKDTYSEAVECLKKYNSETDKLYKQGGDVFVSMGEAESFGNMIEEAPDKDIYYLIKAKDIPVGIINKYISGDKYEYSRIIVSEYRGRGYGTEAVSKLKETIPSDNMLSAYVHIDNIGSLLSNLHAGMHLSDLDCYGNIIYHLSESDNKQGLDKNLGKLSFFLLFKSKLNEETQNLSKNQDESLNRKQATFTKLKEVFANYLSLRKDDPLQAKVYIKEQIATIVKPKTEKQPKPIIFSKGIATNNKDKTEAKLAYGNLSKQLTSN